MFLMDKKHKQFQNLGKIFGGDSNWGTIMLLLLLLLVVQITQTCMFMCIVAMRLSRLYFCYGALLTSVLWLSIILIYFSMPGEHQMSYQHAVVSSQHAVIVSQSEERVSAVTRTNSDLSSSSLLPDLDQLSIVRSAEDKLLHAEGKLCIFTGNRFEASISKVKVKANDLRGQG